MLTAVLAFSLAACGGGSDSGGEGGSQGSGNEVQQEPNENESQDGDGGQDGDANQGEAPSADGEIQIGGVFKIGYQATVVNLGWPGLVAQSNELVVIQPAVESLARYNTEGELVPWLCESFETDADALTLTVKLPQGVKFHDGTDFNAEAVKWNWETFQAAGRSEIAVIESIECPDDATVVAHMSTWDNTVADNALYHAGFMFSPAYCQEAGQEAANANPVGTGPYKFVEWQKDVKLVYEKNEDYRIEGQPYMDGIEFEFMLDSNTISTAYQAGEIDSLPVVDPNIKQIMDATGEPSKAADSVSGGSSIAMVAYGCTDENSPTSKLEVRQAFAYAVDWEEMCGALGGMYYTNQWALPGVWSYNDEVAGYPRDVEKAKELLAKAGYPDGVEITAHCLEAVNTQATMLQQYVAEAGITLNIDNWDQARQDEASGLNGNWDGIIISAGRADTETASIYGRSFTDEGVRYVGGFLHPEDLGEAIANARAAKTEEERASYTKQASKMIIDDYCMMSPIGITSATLYEKDHVHDSGIFQIHTILWTPEACWLSK